MRRIVVWCLAWMFSGQLCIVLDVTDGRPSPIFHQPCLRGAHSPPIWGSQHRTIPAINGWKLPCESPLTCPAKIFWMLRRQRQRRIGCSASSVTKRGDCTTKWRRASPDASPYFALVSIAWCLIGKLRSSGLRTHKNLIGHVERKAFKSAASDQILLS